MRSAAHPCAPLRAPRDSSARAGAAPSAGAQRCAPLPTFPRPRGGWRGVSQRSWGTRGTPECLPRVPAEPPYLRGAARRALPAFPPQRSQTPLRHTARVRSGAHRPRSGTDRPEGRAERGAAPRGWVRISLGARSGRAPGRALGAPAERGQSRDHPAAPALRLRHSSTADLNSTDGLSAELEPPAARGSLDGGRSRRGERPRRVLPWPCPGPRPAARSTKGNGARVSGGPRGWSASCPALRAGVSGRPRSYQATDSFGGKTLSLTRPAFFSAFVFWAIACGCPQD